LRERCHDPAPAVVRDLEYDVVADPKFSSVVAIPPREFAVMIDPGTTPRVRSRMAPGWVRRSVSGLASASLAVGVLTACAGGGDARSHDEERMAAVYGAVILAIADGHPAGAALPVVFVAPRPDAKPIPLTVQAAVVHALAGEVSVRFVDDDNEAIDGAVDGRPVKEGVLLRLGPVAAGDPVEVTADRYRTMTDQQLVTLSVRSNGANWSARVIAEGPLSSVG
jgi:hypothetical protein